MKNILDAIQSDESIVKFLSLINIPMHIENNSFGGELKDLLSELTSSYSYISNLGADVGYIESLFSEVINELVANETKKSTSVYSGKHTQKEKEDRARQRKISSVVICGKEFKSVTIQELIYLKLRVVFLKEKLKAILNTIDKSLFIGNTILAYNKQELIQLKSI